MRFVIRRRTRREAPTFRFFTKFSFYIFLSAIFLYLLSYNVYLGVLSADIGFLIMLAAGLALVFKKPAYGILVLIFELLIGHDGHLFEFSGVSIRLALFMSVMAVWFGQKFFRKEPLKALKSNLAWPFVTLLGFIVFASWHGIFRNGLTTTVFGDIINYFYILLFLPLYEVMNPVRKGKDSNINPIKNPENKELWLSNGVKNFEFKQKLLEVVGGAVLALFAFSFFTLFMFASGAVFIHGPFGFYWWLRQGATAKITLTDFNFFRVVTPAHLLVLPICLIYLSSLLVKKLNARKKYVIALLAGLCSFIILVNFGRAYLLGLIGAFFVLLIGASPGRWLRFGAILALLLVIEMGLIVFFCSQFQAGSFRLLTERASTLLGPSEELSILNREERLATTRDLLSQYPIFGTGLGTTITFFDPILGENKTTYHLDWGWLEIWLELSLFGLAAFLIFLWLTVKQGIIIARESLHPISQRLLIGVSSGLIALVIATATGPYLFHGLGMSYLAFCAALVASAKGG